MADIARKVIAGEGDDSPCVEYVVCQKIAILVAAAGETMTYLATSAFDIHALREQLDLPVLDPECVRLMRSPRNRPATSTASMAVERVALPWNARQHRALKHQPFADSDRKPHDYPHSSSRLFGSFLSSLRTCELIDIAHWIRGHWFVHSSDRCPQRTRAKVIGEYVIVVGGGYWLSAEVTRGEEKD